MQSLTLTPAHPPGHVYVYGTLSYSKILTKVKLERIKYNLRNFPLRISQPQVKAAYFNKDLQSPKWALHVSYPFYLT